MLFAFRMMLHLRNVENFELPVFQKEQVSSIAFRSWTLCCQSKHIAFWRCQLKNCLKSANFIFNVDELWILHFVRMCHHETLCLSKQFLSSILNKVRYYLRSPITMDIIVIKLGSSQTKFLIRIRPYVSLDVKPFSWKKLVGNSIDSSIMLLMIV